MARVNVMNGATMGKNGLPLEPAGKTAKFDDVQPPGLQCSAQKLEVQPPTRHLLLAPVEGWWPVGTPSCFTLGPVG